MRKKENSSDNTTRLCEIDGFDIRLTLANRIFVRTPDGKSGFPYVDYFRNIKFSSSGDKDITLPLAVEAKVRVALANQKRAQEQRRAAELSEPPADLLENN